MSETLFPIPEGRPEGTPAHRGAARLRYADRGTLFAPAHDVMRAIDLLGRAGT